MGANHFVLQVDGQWLREPFAAALEHGGSFPQMPIFYGFRNPGDFWFASHAEPFSVALPKVQGIVAAAKAAGVAEVDADFMRAVRERSKA